MTLYTIASFYKFVALPDYEAMKPALLKIMHAHQIKGTIILASEGINGSFCGEKEKVLLLVDYLKQHEALVSLTFCYTYNEKNPFKKAKVKLRKEIVTIGEEGISPLEMGGTYLDPVEWNALLSDKEVLLIDTRNTYEYKLGTFKGAIDPKTLNFRDFPDYVKNTLMDQKHKKVAMFCTGGIRCEKSTSYMKKMGFNEVYHLQGGILHYLEVTPKEDSLWQGSCFVFDERVALDSSLQSLPEGSIDTEWKNKNKQAFLEEM